MAAVLFAQDKKPPVTFEFMGESRPVGEQFCAASLTILVMFQCLQPGLHACVENQAPFVNVCGFGNCCCLSARRDHLIYLRPVVLFCQAAIPVARLWPKEGERITSKTTEWFWGCQLITRIHLKPGEFEYKRAPPEQRAANSARGAISNTDGSGRCLNVSGHSLNVGQSA